MSSTMPNAPRRPSACPDPERPLRRGHPQWRRNLSIEAQADLIACATGLSGRMSIILVDLVEHLRAEGIADYGMERLLELVLEREAKLSPRKDPSTGIGGRRGLALVVSKHDRRADEFFQPPHIGCGRGRQVGPVRAPRAWPGSSPRSPHRSAITAAWSRGRPAGSRGRVPPIS